MYPTLGPSDHLCVPVLELSKIKMLDPPCVKAKERNAKRGAQKTVSGGDIERAAGGRVSAEPPVRCRGAAGPARPRVGRRRRTRRGSQATSDSPDTSLLFTGGLTDNKQSINIFCICTIYCILIIK